MGFSGPHPSQYGEEWRRAKVSTTTKDSPKAEGAPQFLTLTDRAAGRLKDILAKQGKEAHALRLRVVGGGCAGYSYQMDLDKTVGDDDTVIESKEVRVVIDRRSLFFLRNSELDYVESLMESGFKIQNPNAKGGCSCGESFYA